MNFGLYAAYLGMRARQQRLDLTANNLANAAATGFKADRLLYRSVQAAETGPQQPGNDAAAAAAAGSVADQTGHKPSPATLIRYGRDIGVVTRQATDFSPGPLKETGRSLDVALDGDGFLVVQTPRGERYSRSGSLTIDVSGQLVTHSGDLVIGDGGPITIPPGDLSIADDGSLSVNGRSLGQLKLVRFTNPNLALAKEGHALFVATGQGQPLEATGTHVIQGGLEMSNVDSLTEMVAMMQNTREFDSLERTTSTLMNDLGRKIANELGRL